METLFYLHTHRSRTFCSFLLYFNAKGKLTGKTKACVEASREWKWTGEDSNHVVMMTALNNLQLVLFKLAKRQRRIKIYRGHHSFYFSLMTSWEKSEEKTNRSSAKRGLRGKQRSIEFCGIFFRKTDDMKSHL